MLKWILAVSWGSLYLIWFGLLVCLFLEQIEQYTFFF